MVRLFQTCRGSSLDNMGGTDVALVVSLLGQERHVSCERARHGLVTGAGGRHVGHGCITLRMRNRFWRIGVVRFLQDFSVKKGYYAFLRFQDTFL